jgi:hypothetical protein
LFPARERTLQMKKIIIFFLLFLTSQVSYSIDTSAVKYLPLAVGNKWVFYHYWWNPNPGYCFTSARITKDTVLNGKHYFYLDGIDFLNQWIRFDTLTGNLYKPGGNGSCIHPYEELLDSLASKVTDTFYHCTKQSSDGRRCFDTANFTMNGIQYKAKRFWDVSALESTERRFGRNLGFVGASVGDYYAHHYELRGCVINGIVIGDTSVPLGLIPISINVPESFSLYQNYPNPFNPSTKIKFDVTADGKGQKADVKLVVYDILGKEIASLVNQQLNPGTYEAEWEGSNYPSGVYFYKLTASNFTETKRMVMMK